MSAATRPRATTLASAIDEPLSQTREWGLADSYAFCEKLARSHYENFPVGSLLIPKPLRKHFYAIYAFARIADDFADEEYGQTYSEDDRLELISEWGNLLVQSERGEAKHPVFVALMQSRREFDLPQSLFEDLLSAFSQDVVLRRYKTFEQLSDYCRRSANPIGRLVLMLFGYRDAQRHKWSDDICTALQLANHWQDVSIDLLKDRVYLPEEDLSRFDLSIEDLRNGSADHRFISMMEFQVERAREMFVRGQPLCTSVRGRLGLELRSVWLGGMRILERIELNNYDVFNHRPVITSSDKMSILVRALMKTGFRRS